MKNSLNGTQDPLKGLVTENLEEHPLVQWMVANRKTLLWALLGLIALLIFIFRTTSSKNEKAEHDFMSAEQQYSLLSHSSSKSTSEQPLFTLEEILKRHPELHGKYDALIAQDLINIGDASKALPFALSALQRTEKENQPYYTAFSGTSILIAEGKYQDALTKAQKLHDILKEDKTMQGKETLFAFNLLRIASLQQQLNLSKEELASWLAWKQFIKDQTAQSAFDSSAFVQAMQIGSLSLENYIQKRETDLKALLKNKQ